MYRQITKQLGRTLSSGRHVHTTLQIRWKTSVACCTPNATGRGNRFYPGLSGAFYPSSLDQRFAARGNSGRNQNIFQFQNRHLCSSASPTSNAAATMPATAFDEDLHYDDMHGNAKFDEDLNQVEKPSAADEWRASHSIAVFGKDADGEHQYSVPDPWSTFDMELPFSSGVLTKLRRSSFSAPTPIQAQCWPVCLQNRDIISVSRTGSGKTLGYVLPILSSITPQKVSQNKRTRSRRRNAITHRGRYAPQALILAPTRELAVQIDKEVTSFGKRAGFRSTVLYGGASRRQQIDNLSKFAPEIIVATPGRLVDLCQDDRLSLQNIRHLVLDEADHMLDMGFRAELDSIMRFMEVDRRSSRDNKDSSQENRSDKHSHGEVDTRETPNTRQTLMFSATWPKEVRSLARSYLMNPVQVNVGQATDSPVVNKNITQTIHILPKRHGQREKKDKLIEIMENIPSKSKVIVFTETKRGADNLADFMFDEEERLGIVVESIHSDKSQGQRTAILRAFANSRINCLFATGVAARGLDIHDISHVIVYDFPKPKGRSGMEDFVHRIGRTARGNRKGEAITFFHEERDKNHATALHKILKSTNQEVPPELEAIVKIQEKKNNKRHSRGQRHQTSSRRQRRNRSDDGDRRSNRSWRSGGGKHKSQGQRGNGSRGRHKSWRDDGGRNRGASRYGRGIGRRYGDEKRL